MADENDTGAELKPDGHGGLTAADGEVEKAKKKPAAMHDDEMMDEEKRKKPGADEEADAEKARRRADDGDDDSAEKARKAKARSKEDDDEESEDEDTEKAKSSASDDEDKKKQRKAQHLTIPSPVKEAILRALTEALERLMSVANQVKEAEGTDEQVESPVPDEVGREVTAIATLLTGIGESYPSPQAKAAVAKAGARMAKDRLDRFQKALTLLADILKELTDRNDQPPGPSAGAAEAGVAKRDVAPPPATVPGLTDLVRGIGELTRVVKRQEEELTRIRQARGVSNAIPVDGGRRPEPQDVSWPLDMNRPISRDKVKKEVSFFDE